jgi:hypothetical protein
MTVSEFAAALTRRAELHADEDMLVHVTLPNGEVIVGEITGLTDIGPSEGFALIVSWIPAP